MQYFLYARKSTDKEDMQVLSIEAQLSELRALAKREGLEISEEFVEKQSAKMPGRSHFNDIVERVRKGEAEGIICWKLDRLARNPVDSGQISWLLQEGILKHIQTPERSYFSEDSVLLMSVEFGMANQYIRDLAYNTKRGLREKARRGEFPAPAPLGYQNNPRTKRIDVDKKKSLLIRKAFELYAEGDKRLEDISQFLFENGIKTKEQKRRWIGHGGNRLPKDGAKKILTNTFYYGDFYYSGEWYKGTHSPIVTKLLFDQVQKVIEARGYAHKSERNDPQALCGLMRCGSCGCSITAEVITKKKQKNGIVHRYTYYRCTKKKGACAEPYVREEELTAQLSKTLASFALPENWAKEMFALADKDEQDSGISARASVQGLRDKLRDLDTKLARLTDLYVEQDIERDAYLERKRSLMSERRSQEEQIGRLEKNATAWLQPLRMWIKEAESLNQIAKSEDKAVQKSSLQKIFGSNLHLSAREVSGNALTPWSFIHGGTAGEARNFGSPLWVRRVGFEPT
jgi:DNA invertase Pin-like site-specific DNA recombinase